MRVVVSGGSGLLGGALIASLTGAGWEAVILSRSPSRLGDLPPRVSAVEWDARSVARRWTEACEGADAFVHLAGESLAAGRWTAARKERMWRSRVSSGEALAEGFSNLSQPPKVFLQASGVNYYGAQGSEELDERAAVGEGFLSDLSKAWEGATRGVEELGVRRVILRTGMVLSTEGGALPKLVLPFRLFAGGWMGNGRQWVSWIHLADQVAAMRFLIESPEASGPFNLTAPTPVQNRTLARELGRALHRPSWLPAPAFALKLLLGEMATVLLTGQRVIPRRLLALGFRFRFPTLGGALSDLL